MIFQGGCGGGSRPPVPPLDPHMHDIGYYFSVVSTPDEKKPLNNKKGRRMLKNIVNKVS